MKTILKVGVITVFIGILTPVVFYIGLTLWGMWYDQWSGYNASLYASDGICNIAVASVHGDIAPYHETEDYVTITPGDIRTFFASAESDGLILGTLLEIDSAGGYPAASLAIAEEVERSPLPNAALIGDYGLSGGYLIASAADYIIASPFADVGSIGVTMSYLSNVTKNELEGVSYVPLSSAPFKDAGSPDKTLTAEERALFERDLAIFHDTFVQEVAQNRTLEPSEVDALANGASMPAVLAQQNKLIDSVGTRETARRYFADTLQIAPEEIIFCEPVAAVY